MGIEGLESKMATLDARPDTTPEVTVPEVTIPEGSPNGKDPNDLTTPQGAPTDGDGGEGEPKSDIQNVIADAADKAEAGIYDFEHTIDGKKVKKSYTKEQVQMMLQKSEGADKRFSEAARIEKREQQLIWLAQNRPDVFLQQVGVDPDQFSHDRILKKIEYDAMSPEQRASLDTTEKLRVSEQEKAKLQQQIEQEQLTAQTQQSQEFYARDIRQALGDSKMPINQYTTRRVSYYLLEAYNKMGVKLPAKDVMPLVREDYVTEQRALFGAADADTMVDMLGADVRKKYRDYELSQLQGKGQEKREVGKKKGITPVKTDASQKKFKSMDDFRAHNAAIKGESY